MNLPKVQIVILTRNRSDLVTKTLRSILKQTFKDIQVIISDNSTDNCTYQTIIQQFPHISNLRYVRRIPCFQDFFQHANKVISEIESEYFMLFHDDDLMLPDLVKKSVEALDKNKELTAVASNAYNIDINDNVLGKFSKKKKRLHIDSVETLIPLYANNNSLPFPSYMYRTSKIKKLLFDSQKGGKYSDSCFILDLLDYGDILFLYDFYGMLYRRSDFQDSHFMDVKARCKQIKYFAKKSNINYHSHIISKWRLKEIYTYFYLEKKPVRKIILKLFFKNHLYELFFKSIIKKIFIKWKLFTLK